MSNKNINGSAAKAIEAFKSFSNTARKAQLSAQQFGLSAFQCNTGVPFDFDTNPLTFGPCKVGKTLTYNHPGDHIGSLFDISPPPVPETMSSKSVLMDMCGIDGKDGINNYDLERPVTTNLLEAMKQRTKADIDTIMTEKIRRGFMPIGNEHEEKPDKTGSTAVISVRGAMTNRSWWRTSYQRLSAQIDEAMNDSSVDRIVFDMDSPGGEVGGVFDLADKIYAARAKKPMSAVVSENACSACYLLAAAAGDKKMKVLPGTFSEEETQPQEAKQEQSNEEQANANSD